jgi:hypothetical protein
MLILTSIILLHILYFCFLENIPYYILKSSVCIFLVSLLRFRIYIISLIDYVITLHPLIYLMICLSVIVFEKQIIKI